MLAKDYRAKAWAAMSGKKGILALITLIYSLIIGGCSAIPGVGQMAAIVVGGPFFLALAMIALAVLRGEDVAVESLFAGFKDGKFLPAFLLNLVNGIFIALWSLLLVAPGIIKAYAYAMSTYIMAENPGMSQKECREESMRMMMGNKWRLFCLHFSFIGWGLLCALTLGILSFWVTPYMRVAEAAFYEDLKARRAA